MTKLALLFDPDKKIEINNTDEAKALLEKLKRSAQILETIEKVMKILRISKKIEPTRYCFSPEDKTSFSVNEMIQKVEIREINLTALPLDWHPIFGEKPTEEIYKIAFKIFQNIKMYKEMNQQEVKHYGDIYITNCQTADRLKFNPVFFDAVSTIRLIQLKSRSEKQLGKNHIGTQRETIVKKFWPYTPPLIARHYLYDFPTAPATMPGIEKNKLFY